MPFRVGNRRASRNAMDIPMTVRMFSTLAHIGCLLRGNLLVRTVFITSAPASRSANDTQVNTPGAAIFDRPEATLRDSTYKQPRILPLRSQVRLRFGVGLPGSIRAGMSIHRYVFPNAVTRHNVIDDVSHGRRTLIPSSLPEGYRVLIVLNSWQDHRDSGLAHWTPPPGPCASSCFKWVGALETSTLARSCTGGADQKITTPDIPSGTPGVPERGCGL